MTKLVDIANIIRSKNSGPYELTMDIIFKSTKLESFMRIRHGSSFPRRSIPISLHVKFVCFSSGLETVFNSQRKNSGVFLGCLCGKAGKLFTLS